MRNDPTPALRADPPLSGEGKQKQPLVMVAAGGTGGHLFPAESLSAALAKRGIGTVLATDNRAAKYGEHFKSWFVVPSATFSAAAIRSRSCAPARPSPTGWSRP